MEHVTTIKVRGYHCDFYGHVNNARYLEFLEEARWEYLEAGLDLEEWKQKGLGFVVAGINIKYRRPASLNAVLEIRSCLSSLGERSGVIHQDVVMGSDGVLVAAADVTFAVVDLRTGRGVPLTGEIREILAGGLPPRSTDIPDPESDGK